MTAVDERGMTKVFEEGQGEDADYLGQEVVKFGDPVPLEVLGLELDTTEFGTFPDVRPHRYP